ncbi:hypothetical protein EPK97_06590 [Chengkuizengella sediminis]|nr:hypothetical protein [Chengkuizengella sediminis]
MWCLVFLFSLIGCKDQVESGVLIISPDDFFKDDTKYLEPHLGWITGSFHINYSGPEKYLNISMEVYENGQLIKSSKLMESEINMEDSQMSFSIQDHVYQEGLKKLIITSEDLNGTSSIMEFDIEFDDHLRASGYTYLNDEIKITEGNEAIIWGYFLTEENRIRTPNDEHDLLEYDRVFALKASLDVLEEKK